MLEHQELWLRSTPGDLGPCWTIQSSVPERLGHARWRSPPSSRWRRWLWRPALEVVETDDESLVFTIRRHWSRQAWEVRDADEHSLGTVAGGVLYDVMSRRLAFVSGAHDEPTVSIVSTDGLALATLRRGADGTCLTFGAAVNDNPFLKMLLLACVLVPGR
jgi:hypothetical protein